MKTLSVKIIILLFLIHIHIFSEDTLSINGTFGYIFETVWSFGKSENTDVKVKFHVEEYPNMSFIGTVDFFKSKLPYTTEKVMGIETTQIKFEKIFKKKATLYYIHNDKNYKLIDYVIDTVNHAASQIDK